MSIKNIVLKFISNINENGLVSTVKKCYYFILLRTPFKQIYLSNKEIYKPPLMTDIKDISVQLKKLTNFSELEISVSEYDLFMKEGFFPVDYHGGNQSPIWRQKVLEHYLAWKLLNLSQYHPSKIYLDIAASNSPWAYNLNKLKNINAYSVDLLPPKINVRDERYVQADATTTKYRDNSVSGMSLQCSFEMFVGDADIKLIKESSRILEPGGKLLITPLYLHTHHCYYSSSEYYGQNLGDAGAKKYIRSDLLGVAASRKYSVDILQERILDTVKRCGLKYTLFQVTNLASVGSDLYLHFALLVEKE